jgi:hypothetical protein
LSIDLSKLGFGRVLMSLFAEYLKTFASANYNRTGIEHGEFLFAVSI